MTLAIAGSWPINLIIFFWSISSPWPERIIRSKNSGFPMRASMASAIGF